MDLPERERLGKQMLCRGREKDDTVARTVHQESDSVLRMREAAWDVYARKER